MEMAGPRPDTIAENANSKSNAVPHLPSFKALGDQVFYHQVPESKHDNVASEAKAPPDLIITCSWLYAHFKHIAKYTNHYQKIYPSSPILLLKQDGPDLMWRPDAWQMQNMKPAVDVVSEVKAQKQRKPRILMHIFSNGGAYTATQFADAYELFVGEKLPMDALIIDSAPSIVSASSGFTAMSQGLPATWPAPVKVAGGVVLYSFMMGVSLASRALGSEGTISGMRRKLNERNGAFMVGGLRRVYLYSRTDQLVPWEHVEEHAKEARVVREKQKPGSGEDLVRLEQFDGSKHVAHVMVDPERYWGVVRNTWQSSGDSNTRSEI